MSAVLHSGAYLRSPAGDGGLRMCPACGTEYPPAGPNDAPITPCPNEGYAILRKEDVLAARGDIMLGRTVAQRFTIVARLGTGSMGAVYRAWQDRMARWVALKIMRYDRTINAESRARFEREARSMSQLQSPHTVTVFDFGEAEDGSVYLAMELLEGESLGQRLNREGRLPIRDAVHFARGALTSLAEAHSKGIIHRDLKPDNLFLTEVLDVGGSSRELCKLLDFGIAKVMREERIIDALETQAGTVFGTPRYMSPEQAQGLRLDARSDIYSLGVILYQMVTGVPPFDDEEAVVVMARHIKTKPISPREVAPEVEIPAELERVILRALAKDPVDRPETADTFILALEVAEKSFPASLPVSPPLARTRRTSSAHNPLPTLAPTALRRRKRLIAAGVVVGLVGTVAAGAALLHNKGNASGVETAASAVVASDGDDIVFEFGEEAAPAASSAEIEEEPLTLDKLPIFGKPVKTTSPGTPRATSRPSASATSPKTAAPVPSDPPTSAPPPAPSPTPTSTSKYGRFE